MNTYIIKRKLVTRFKWKFLEIVAYTIFVQTDVFKTIFLHVKLKRILNANHSSIL